MSLNKVKCTNCNNEVYKQVVEISMGMPIEASQFKGINGYPDPKDGDAILCPACGNYLAQSLENSIGHGVIP